MVDVTKAHVFISHSARDDAIGRRVYTAFEKTGIRCWYSSRPTDLEPGVEWDDNIVAALDRSVAVVLLFSAAANASRWVKRELVMAEARELLIYPIRIENIRPTGGMEAHLVSVQWTDAFDGSLENRLGLIVNRLRPRFPLPRVETTTTVEPTASSGLAKSSFAKGISQPSANATGVAVTGQLAEISRIIEKRYQTEVTGARRANSTISAGVIRPPQASGVGAKALDAKAQGERVGFAADSIVGATATHVSTIKVVIFLAALALCLMAFGYFSATYLHHR